MLVTGRRSSHHFWGQNHKIWYNIFKIEENMFGKLLDMEHVEIGELTVNIKDC